MSRHFQSFGSTLALLAMLLAAAGRSAAHAGDERSAGDAAPRPTLRVSEASFDWGELLDGEEVVHAFRIHNDGAAPLHLERIRPG